MADAIKSSLLGWETSFVLRIHNSVEWFCIPLTKKCVT